MTTQQQRAGAQRLAASRVREQEAAFQQELARVLDAAESLRPQYAGPAAEAFFALVGQWLAEAGAVVRDLEGFAARLERQDREVDAEQEQTAGSFRAAAHRLTTTF